MAHKTPAAAKAYKKAWIAANKDRVNEQARKDAKSARRRDGDRLRARARAYRNANGKNSEYNLTRKLKKFGITRAQYDSAAAEQNGGCAICGGPSGKKNSRHAIDHCHDSGEFRGLLCHPCNTAIGLMREDPARIVRAAEYLRKHEGLKLKALIG